MSVVWGCFEMSAGLKLGCGRFGMV